MNSKRISQISIQQCYSMNIIPAITSHQITTNTLSSNDEMRNRKCLNNKTFYSTYRGVSDGSNEIMFEEGHYKVKYTILTD